MNPEPLARKGYHAYGGITEHKNYKGDPMPKFDELPPKIQAAWTAFAARVHKGGTVEEGYEAYGDVVEWKNFEGKPIPKFNEPPMTEKIVEAWKAAHACIRGLIEPPTPSDVSLVNE